MALRWFDLLDNLLKAPPSYNYHYAVRDEYSGNDFGQQEERDGYMTKGSYSVRLPDGRVQRVTYYVDGDSGFMAEVSYEGEAQYPAHQPAASYQPAPTYQTTPAYQPTPAYKPAPTYQPGPTHQPVPIYQPTPSTSFDPVVSY
ncbi:cuticle protein 7-like [Penaeus monodon]|uniref:cuticle protein 7-like n=1 Tax=Penaeus monodon TaxID=6687 RepID=UPI0018A7AB71|nr:cuticle protein 7-like [Penaeus monodon]